MVVQSPDGRLEVELLTRAANPSGRLPALYVADPKATVPRPPKELKGFTKVSLEPGESRKVSLPLNTRAFAFYDVARRQWRAEAGEFQILVGDSTEQIALKGSLTLARTMLAKE